MVQSYLDQCLARYSALFYEESYLGNISLCTSFNIALEDYRKSSFHNSTLYGTQCRIGVVVLAAS